MKRILLALACATFLAAAPMASWSNAHASPDYGSLATGAVPDRTITIRDSTKYVNVTKFETIRFLVRGADGRESNFVWRFDTLGVPIFPLKDIAPAGLLGNQSPRVYVAMQPIGT